MNCIIIDDEATSRTIIGELCSSYKNLNVVEVFSNAIEAIKYLNQNKTDLIFLDIETVPLEYDFKNLPRKEIELWDKKSKYVQRYQDISAEEAYNKAGIYAEFGKIICISVGYFTEEKKNLKLRVKSFFGDGSRYGVKIKISKEKIRAKTPHNLINSK